jgi:23S rRNA maturation mini-RNase III
VFVVKLSLLEQATLHIESGPKSQLHKAVCEMCKTNSQATVMVELIPFFYGDD